jgi:mRNA interferase MazF
MRQYEIRWAAMPPPIGRRPVMLLSRDAAFSYLNKVIVAEVTTTVRNIPQEVALDDIDGLPQPSVVNFDNLHVIAKARVGARIGSLDASRVQEAKRALGYALDWPELKVL